MSWIFCFCKILKQIWAVLFSDLIAFHDWIFFQFPPDSFLFSSHIKSNPFAKNFFLLFYYFFRKEACFCMISANYFYLSRLKQTTAAGGTDAFPVINSLTAHIFCHNYSANLCDQVPSVSINKLPS